MLAHVGARRPLASERTSDSEARAEFQSPRETELRAIHFSPRFVQAMASKDVHRYPLQGPIHAQMAMLGGNTRASSVGSPSTLTCMPAPAGTQPSPSAACRATLTSNPEQCIGRTYAGAGRNLRARKSTVGAMREASSGPPRWRPPMICAHGCRGECERAGRVSAPRRGEGVSLTRGEGKG